MGSLQSSKTQQHSDDEFLVSHPQQLVTCCLWQGYTHGNAVKTIPATLTLHYTRLGRSFPYAYMLKRNGRNFSVTSSLGFSGEPLTPSKNLQKHLFCLLSPGNTLSRAPWLPLRVHYGPPGHDSMSSVFRSRALSTRRCQLLIPALRSSGSEHLCFS